jgi:site-specific recombinase XerC
MTNLINNGCSFSDVWVSPSNWKTISAKKGLEANWYVQCNFYDPRFKEKYPKGFPFRKKLNRLKTIEDRRSAVQIYLEEIPKLLRDKKFNPITNEFEVIDNDLLSSKSNFRKALHIYDKLQVSHNTKIDLKSVVVNFIKVADKLNIDIEIGELHSGHIRDVLDALNISNDRFNKYLTYLSMIFAELCEKRIILTNPVRDIRKRKTIKKSREVFEINELEQIFEYLKSNYYEFYRYGMIFFHSGSRTTELFRVQKFNVNLDKKEYKTLILKGSSHKEVKKPILKNVIEFWDELIDECKNDSDFLFGKGLKPNEKPIKSYQITKRFKRLVKDKLCFAGGKLITITESEKNKLVYSKITADFYSLKHLFLDELDRVTSDTPVLNLSKELACHTTNITERTYLVGKADRKNEILKNIDISFLKVV